MRLNLKAFLQGVIFNSKWLLYPFLIKLVISYIILGYHYIFEDHVTNEQVMHILHEVDIVMIAYLVRMIVIGLYHSAIDKTHAELGEKISSGLLKVKLSTSILGVSSIHLLQTFMSVSKLYDGTNLTNVILVVSVQLAIHITFIFGSLALAKMEYMHEKGEALGHNEKH